MNRYCKCCKKPREHRRLKGVNTATKVLGGAFLLVCGCPPIMPKDEFECNHCGNKVEDD